MTTQRLPSLLTPNPFVVPRTRPTASTRPAPGRVPFTRAVITNLGRVRWPPVVGP